MPLRERLEMGGGRVEARDEGRERGGVTAPNGDPGLADLVERVTEQWVELLLQVVRARIGRLDGIERSLHAADALLGVGDDDRGVGTERVAIASSAGDECGGSHVGD